MAKAFELNTMNCSRLTARMAGIESTANTTSLVSTTMSTANSGVASSLPACRTNRCWPLYSVVDGITLRTRLSTGLCSGWTSSSSWRSMRAAVISRSAPNTNSIHSNRSSSADPGEDEHEPQHQGAEDAPEQHPELVRPGHGEVAHDQRPHEHVVDAEALLDQVAGDVLGGRLPAVPPHMTNVNDRPMPIHTADSMAASLVVGACGLRCTISRSPTSSTVTKARNAQPRPTRGRRSWRSCRPDEDSDANTARTRTPVTSGCTPRGLQPKVSPATGGCDHRAVDGR